MQIFYKRRLTAHHYKVTTSTRCKPFATGEGRIVFPVSKPALKHCCRVSKRTPLLANIWAMQITDGMKRSCPLSQIVWTQAVSLLPPHSPLSPFPPESLAQATVR